MRTYKEDTTHIVAVAFMLLKTKEARNIFSDECLSKWAAKWTDSLIVLMVVVMVVLMLIMLCMERLSVSQQASKGINSRRGRSCWRRARPRARWGPCAVVGRQGLRKRNYGEYTTRAYLV